MTATFQIQIRRVLTTNQDGLSNVVKQVEYELVGTQDGQTFSLPQTKALGDADPANFTQFASLTPELIESWIGEPDSKAHIQWVLDTMCAKAALESQTPPWVPAETAPEAPQPAP